MRRLVKTFGSLLLFGLLFVVAQTCAALLAGLFGWSGSDGVSDFGFMTIYLVSMLFTFMLVSLQERVSFGSIRRVEHSRRGFDPVGLLCGVVLIVAISVVLLPLGEVLPVNQRSFPDGGWTLFSVTVLAPVLEELIFRARLYNNLSRNLSPLMAASFSALMFGLVHLDPLVIIEGFIVGIVFSYFYLQKRSIIAPILLHACNNAMAYMLHFVSYRDEPLMDILGSSLSYYVVYAVCAAIVLFAAVVIIRRFVVERRALRVVAVEEVEYDEPMPASDEEDDNEWGEE